MSNSVDYRIFIDSKAVTTNLNRLAMGLDSYLNSLLVTGANATKDELKSKAPEGVSSSGNIKGSVDIAYDISGPGVHRANIAPKSEHAPYVEMGTRPHTPPSDALEAWAASKGIQVWALVMSIRRKGTKAHPFVEPTYQTMRPIVERQFDDGVTRYIAGLS